MTGRVIIVYNFDDAWAALAAAVDLGVPVTLRSPPDAGAYLGAPVFREMVEAARAAHPEAEAVAVFDCGDDAGFALSALRHGFKRIRIDLPAEARARLADIARRYGADLDDDGAPVLDLLDCEAPVEACREWLAGGSN